MSEGAVIKGREENLHQWAFGKWHTKWRALALQAFKDVFADGKGPTLGRPVLMDWMGGLGHQAGQNRVRRDLHLHPYE